MTILRQRFLPLLGLLSAVLLAPPTRSWAETSLAAANAIDATDVVTGHGFNIILYLPIGLLLAAILLEWFAQWKGNRDVEPAILFLLFATVGAAGATAVLALAFAKVGREAGQLSAYFTWTLFLAGVTALAFYLKRRGRDERLFALSPPPNLSGRVVTPRTGAQKGLIIGYRAALIAAVLIALAGISEMPVGNVPLKSLAATIRSLTEPAPGPAKPVAKTDSDETPVLPLPPQSDKPKPPDAPSLASLIGQQSTEPKPAEANPLVTAASNSITRPTPAEAEAAQPKPTTPPPATTPPVASTPPPEPATPPPPIPPSPPPQPTATPPSPATTPTVAPASTTPKPQLEKNFFATKIKPIFDSKCTTCHGSSKQKGDLRLDSIENIKKGSDHPIVKPGSPETSPLYTRLTSPDEEDIMPPKEKGGPLPAAQIELFKKWILAGADFGDGSATVAIAPAATPGGKIEEELSQKLPAPDGALLTRLSEAGVIIRPLSSNGALLDLNFSHAEMVNLAELAPIAKNIFALDLTRSKIRDDQLVPLAQMTNLRRLQLNRNPITDAGLVHLKGLTELEVLNLYETGVTDTGLDHLMGLKKLQKLFLFNTKCTPAGEDKLKAQIPGIDVNRGV